MHHTYFALSSCLLLVAVACSSSSSNGSGSAGDTLDCNYLTGDNCYKTTVAAAASCLPSLTAQGTLSADGKTCTFTTGQSIAFDSPLTLPLPQNPTFNFTMTANGALCIKVEQPSSADLTVTTSAGTFVESSSASSGTLSLSCPGGAKYSSADPLELLACDGGLFNVPGTQSSSGSTTVSFSLFGTANATTPIFTCATM